MEILRKIFHGAVVGLFGFVVAVGILASAASLVLTEREVIKSWPQDAGLYPKISDQLLSLMERGEEQPEGGESLEEMVEQSPLDKERLSRAIKSVYDAGYWQEKYESFIDAIYDWLEGQDEVLNFTIAFNDRNQQLADALEKELAEQLSEYPRCPATTNFDDFDPLQASCLPQGITAKQAAERFSAELLGEDSFLADAVITQDDLELDEEFRRTAPDGFALLQRLPWLVGGLAALLGLVAVFTAKSRLYGLRKIGQVLFGIGLVSWIGFFLSNRLAANLSFRPDEGESDPDAFNEIAQPLVRAVVDDVTTAGLWVSLFVVITGALIWLGAYTWHKVHHHDEAETIAKRAMAQKSSVENNKLPPPVRPDATDAKPDKK